MALTLNREVQTRVSVEIGKLLPDFFAVFDLVDLHAIHVNQAGLHFLDPKGKIAVEKLVLNTIIGMNDIDRFNQTIYPQVRVMGSWAGTLVLRDLSGSEVTCSVRMSDTLVDRETHEHWLYLHASPSPDEVSSVQTITDRDMLNALLETSPNSIYFKDTASRFLRIGRTLSKSFGLDDPREAIGKTDFDFFTAEHAAPAFEDEQRIQKTNVPVVDLDENETHSDGRITWVSTSKFPFHNRAGKLVGTFGISRDITERKIAEEKLRMLSRAVEHSPVSIVITDTRGKIEYVNPYCEKITGYAAAEIIGRNPRIVKSGRHSPEFYQELWNTITAGNEWNGEIQNRRKDGELYWEHTTISAIRNAQGQITHFVAVKEDITERKRAEAEHREQETQSQLSQKLQSVGMLAAGVAHEINTPTQYITDNTRFLTESFTQLLKVITSYRALATAHPECSENLKEVAAVETENELEYLITEIPKTLSESLEGLGRITRIVSSLKEFSHPNSEAKSGANLNKAVETTVAVSRHEWKYVADVVTELDPELPQVHCVLDEFNQAVLNLIINATHTIDDAIKQRGIKRGTITIRTRQEPGWAVVEVEDTGTGIPPEVRGRIFDPFFTTKGIGKGTGQGLAIVQSVIVKGHGGKIDFTTEMGKGTTFRIMLPLNHEHAPVPHSVTTPPMPVA